MVYKKYIKRGEKVFGPYYYESYRDEKGHVKTRYLENYKPKSTKKLVFLSIFLGLLLLSFIFYQFTGYAPLDNEGKSQEKAAPDTEKANKVEKTEKIDKPDKAVEAEKTVSKEVVDKEVDKGSADKEVVDKPKKPKLDEETTEPAEPIIDKPVSESTSSKKKKKAEETEVNESDVNETIGDEEIIINETIVNETIINETEEVIINETVINEKIINETIVNKTTVNETIINETVINETIVNETIINETIIVNETIINITIINETLLNITTKHYKAVIGRPVKWIKTIKLDNETRSLKVKLPKHAEKIAIKTGKEVQEALQEIEDYEDVIENSDKEDLIGGIITGYVSLDIERNKGIFSRIWDWLTSFTMTGSVILEEEIGDKIIETEENKIIELDEIVNLSQETDLAVEYYTEPPQAVEQETANGKRIVIYGPDDLHYEDVLAYTLINNSIKVPEQIKLYWDNKETGIREQVNFNSDDLDSDGNIDYIEWVVPHLSNQTYELEIIILNVQSYPTLYGNWTVRFNTTGTANLTITPVNGTTWDLDDPKQLKFLELRCGNTILNYTWLDETDSVFYPDYSCNKTGYEISKVMIAGKHALEFDFGGVKVYAYNSPSIEIGNCTELQNMSANLSAGYILIDDIDCSDTINWNDGAGFEPIGNSTAKFNGTLDGKNHTITGLYINRSGTNYVGLFGYANSGSKINNVGLVNINITGTFNVGGLVGMNDGLINKTYSTGYVYGSGTSVGGLVGNNYEDIYNSYSRVEVYNSNERAGGLAGNNQADSGGHIENCYAVGNVIGSDYVGGLVGITQAGASINNSFATGNVSASGGNVGGLIGNNNGDTITNVYYYNHTGNPSVCIGSGSGGENCTAINNESYFFNVNQVPMINWSFPPWDNFCDNSGYTSLEWENLTDISECQGYTTCDYYLDDCKNSSWESGKTYCLNQGIINATTTCMNVTNDSITLNCQGFNMTGDGGAGDYGIYNYGYDNVTVKNCKIYNFQMGIFWDNGANYNFLFNNTANDNSFYGIQLVASSHNNLTSNTANNNSISGIYLATNSDNNTLTSNTANNNDVAIYIYLNSHNNTLTNNTLINNLEYGIKVTDSNDSLIYNNFFSNTNNAYDDSYNDWNTTYNCSAGPNIVEGNCMGGNYFSDYAGFDDGSGSYPYNISEDGIGDTLIPHNVNITNGGDYLPLAYECEFLDDCKTSGWEYGRKYCLNQSISTNGGCMVINNDLVTLDCKGFNITGDGGTGDYGIDNDDYDNVIIKNCNINGFDAGLYWYYNADYGLISNNTISNNTNHGILIQGSSNNTFTNNTIISNSQEGIYITNYSIWNPYGWIQINSSDNLIYNNFFNNINNAFDDSPTENYWNTTYNCAIPGYENIIGENCTGGNYWSDYAGEDDGSGGDYPYNIAGDRIGDTLIPYNASEEITNGGDYLPLFNNLPSLNTPILKSTDETNYANENLICQARATDIDEDNITYNGFWYKNSGKLDGFTLENQIQGQGVSVSTLSSSDTSVGDVWKCEVRAYDGVNYIGYKMSNSLTIISAPGGGSGGCRDLCSSGSEEKVCVNSTTLKTRVCGDYNFNGCSEWSDWSYGNCEENEYCNEELDRCMIRFIDECILNEGACVDENSYVICGDYDNDGYTEWSGSTYCEADEKCEEGECIMAICDEDWDCDWSACINGFFTPDCNDLNECGTTTERPEKVPCDEEIKKKDCRPDIVCNAWGDCDASYNFNDLLSGVEKIGGKQFRVCEDREECIAPRYETKNCSIELDIYAKRKTWCGKDYIEIYNKFTGELLSRINDRKTMKNPSLDISLLTGKAVQQYCDYCFNGIKDGDEEGIDCGGSCMDCVYEGYILTWFEKLMWELGY